MTNFVTVYKEYLVVSLWNISIFNKIAGTFVPDRCDPVNVECW